MNELRVDALCTAVDRILPLVRKSVEQIKVGAPEDAASLEAARRLLIRARNALIADTQPIDPEDLP